VETVRFDGLIQSVSYLISRRTLAGAFGVGALGLPRLSGARKKRKNKKKRCQPCPAPDTCPDRVCCECGTQSPAPGCHHVDLASNPSPSDVIAACENACGGPEHWVGGDTSFTDGGLSVACDFESHCMRVLCPI
jgi:hypothetical protein